WGQFGGARVGSVEPVRAAHLQARPGAGAGHRVLGLPHPGMRGQVVTRGRAGQPSGAYFPDQVPPPVDAVIRPLRPLETPVTRVGPWDPGRTMTNRPARITTPVRNAPMLRFTGLALLLAQHVQLRETDDQQGADHDSRPDPDIIHDARHG